MPHPTTHHSPADEARDLALFHERIHGLLDQVAHDFRTPLTVIKEFATLMGDGLVGDVGPRQHEFLDVINDRADDLTLVVDNVLDAGRSGAGLLRGWRRPTDVVQVVLGARNSLARKMAVKKVRFDAAIASNLPPVHADPDQLARVLMNLVAGVLKNFEEPEAVQLWTRDESEPGRVGLGLSVEGGHIGPKRLAAVMAALDQTRPCDVWHARGPAWPFALARQLVDLHFGHIRFQHVRAGRTTFALSLPAAEPRCVLGAWQRHVVTTGGESAEANLATVSMDSPARPAAIGVVDEFLQSSVGPNDLALHVEPHRWLLIVPGDEPSAERLVERIESSWFELCRRRSGGLLPQLTWTPLGRDDLSHGADALLARSAW
ncbi:MAG TPA: HAMP domain-containing sensor histidine kinase [Thermoguttaceae bacterium]|nr:HAMP domain-containing sensor histidine kinase [Thermoguttaceae bacterium]